MFGRNDLSNISKKEISIINSKIEIYKRAVQQIREVGFDLDKTIDNIIGSFRINTENTTKQFFKISKKDNSRKAKIRFMKKYIIPAWINLVENKLGEEDNLLIDIRETLDNEKFIAYIMGIYIGIHSKSLANEIKDYVSFVIAEMSINTALKDKKLEKEE